MAYIEKSSIFLAKKEASFGDPATTFSYVTDVVELIDPTLDGETELVEREVMVNSLVKAKPITGKQTSSGSFGLEATAMATGALNGDLFYEAGLGARIAPVVEDVGIGVAGVSATTITVTNGALYTVGQALRVSMGLKDDEYVVVRSIATNTLTVSPALSNFALVDGVTGLLSFVVPKPDEPTISIAMKEYISNGVTPIEYTYRGVVVSDLTINYPVGNIVKADFSVAGAGFAVATGVASQSPSCFSLTPYVAKNMTFTYAGTPYDVADLTVNVASDVTDTEAITTDGITKKTIVGKSAVGGSFSLDYAGTGFYNAYIQGTTGELFGTVTALTGAVHGVYMPNVMVSGNTRSKDAGLIKDNVDFSALSSGLDCSVEDAITLFFS